MTPYRYTGLAADDRRIHRELQAMGAFDQAASDDNRFTQWWFAVTDMLTWLRWKGEVAANGCRLGVSPVQRRFEGVTA